MPDQKPSPLDMQDNENISGENTGDSDRFESDTQKLVRKHLEDPNHEITEEEFSKVRVGMTPPEFDTATDARFEGAEKLKEAEEEQVGDISSEEDEETEGGQKITPWDTIDPK